MASFFQRLQMRVCPNIRNVLKKPMPLRVPMRYSFVVLVTGGFCASTMAVNTSNIMAKTHPNIEEHFHLLETLRDLAPKIDAPRMLHQFLRELKREQSSDGSFSSQFVSELFSNSGIADKELTNHLINIMDWNNNGRLTKYEVAALFTLFNVGSDDERYKFLFECLDLDQSGFVNQNEFREILVCLLEAKYHIYGMENERDPDEIYYDIGPDDYHTMAKFAANHLVRKIFIFADQKRRGRLNWPEFLKWSRRGGNEVMALRELLYQTHDQSPASEVIHQYKVGHIPSR
eukprot:CAMPEP_0197073418 /NCGR_PEP_ID=MMETSP1384-20130603/210598_1 /TAXON_ID=29189 /ORGANISM="Ammonia sp." /LENGTH=287 /DNA_ID=CAMNT_0042512255 /DNA_START=36 /DNA_END=899 /DNA_ORIENTATION=+